MGRGELAVAGTMGNVQERDEAALSVKAAQERCSVMADEGIVVIGTVGLGQFLQGVRHELPEPYFQI